ATLPCGAGRRALQHRRAARLARAHREGIEMNGIVEPGLLRAALSAEADVALTEMLRQLTAQPRHIDRLFPAAARRTARGDVGLRDAAGRVVLAEDAVRVELFVTALAAMSPEHRESEAASLYRFGDSDEKRAVLLG